jgi:hypothetical protein
MLNRSSFLVFSGLCSSFAFGCDRASDEQQDAVGAQEEANAEISEANREARDKTVSAQADADKKIAEAQANFMKLREDFRHESATKRLDLDRRIAELEAKAITLTNKDKTELESKLAGIRSQREQYTNDYQTIETASASTWDATKVGLEKQWKDLEQAVSNAL